MESRRTFVPYLPRLVVEWSRDAPGRSSQVLDGSLVSVDISGFTSLAERLQAKGRAGAEELVLLLGGIFEALIGVSGRLAGDVLKFRGDALLVFFAGDGHELRAARAAADMQWCIEHMGPTMSSAGEVKLRMSAGVYSGPCHFFLVDSSHRELVVTGPAATETIRLESAAGAGEVAVSPATAAVLDAGWVAGATNGGSLLHLAALQDAGGGAPPAADSPEPVDGLESFIPAPLRSHLLRGMGEAEHRQITAGFLAYSGVDTLLSLDGVDGVAAALGALGSLVGEVTSELAITWLESDIDTDGGKLYLTAGAPLTTGADEERMLRALRTLVDEPSPLMLRAGVNRGPAFAGDVGSSTRRTYAVLGDVVNLAARLAARAGPGQILATSEVLDRSNTRYAVEPQPFLMKGKERAITAYRVAESVGTAPAAPERQLPIVGRDPELAALLAAVEGARMRTPHTIELVGEPGIGKSRLVAETRELTAGFTQLVGHCDQYRSSTAFYALRGVLRTLAGIPDELSAAEAGARLKPWVEAVIPDLAPLLPLLAIPFEAEVPSTPESDEIDPAFRRARLHTVVEQFLVRVLVMPTLLVFEDAHWMDDASFSLLQHLSASRIPRPWLTVITRRPSGTPLLTEGEDWAEVLELQPLPPEQASQLALAVAGELALPEDVVAAVSARSGGNPLFVRELVTASRGEVDGAGALPETIETLLTARIDTLDPDERFLLRNAAVLGGRFELSLLREVLGDDLEDPGDLDRWRRLGEFVRWDGPDELHFLHDLFRTVAYEGLSFRRRRDVHGRVARVLEARAGDDVSEIAAFLSLHYSRAEAHAESWRYSVQAGDLARKSFANVDAAELYQRALAATEHVEIPSEEVGRVAESLGDVLELAGRYDAARAAYVRAGIHVTDPVSEARYLLKDGIVSERLGHYPDALDRYDRALERIGAVPGEQAPLELAVAGVKYRQGHFHEGIEWSEHAAEHAEQAGDRASLAHAHYLLHANKTALGITDPAHTRLALPILEEVGDLVGQSSLLNNLGIEAYYAGRWDDAIDLYRRAGELSARAGDVVNVARARNNEAEIRSDQGRLAEAGELLDEAQRVWRAAHYTVGIALATSNLGRLAARSGRFDEADRLLRDAHQRFESLGSEALAQEADVRRVECFVLSGRFQEALELLPRVAAEAGQDGVLPALLERLYGYALVQARRPDEAGAHFDGSKALAQSVGATYELALTLEAVGDGQAARAILEDLGVVATPRIPLP